MSKSARHESSPDGSGASHHLRPTAPPAFDLNQFARDAESALRTADLKDLGAALAPVYANRRSDVPRRPEDRIARQLLDRIDEVARRTELVAALLRAGGIAPAAGARAIASQLDAIGTAAADTNEQPIASLVSALRMAVERLGRIADEHAPPVRDVLVLEPDAVSRDLIALAVESQGHRVRVAGTLT
jgi:hypothetical protein